MQGFNMGRYVPPDLEGLTTGNKLHNKHPLGSRARNLQSTGALTVRFEMPFAIWCTTCQPHETIIGQGVRFNAEKKKIGNYYSTPIYSFRMKHGACGGWIEIHTDPKNTEYVVISGARRRDYGVDEEGRKVGEIITGDDKGKMDALERLEGKVVDKKRGEEKRDRILELQRRQARDWEDPYEKSRRIRRVFRAERKGLEKKEEEREKLKDKLSLGIEVVDEIESDRVRAGMVDFGETGSGVDGRRARIKPLFGEEARVDGGKKEGKRMKAKEVLEDRKAAFRSELRGNTRAAVDPFLSSDSGAWRPEVKRRKIVSGSKADDGKDSGETGSEVEKSVGETEETARPTLGLVSYASDSE
ncbi:hypothetical protein CBS115989_3926 [Aspergillus niger]|nr:DUF572-domain-containing protein [Aspergillus niger CBS 101883]KAI2820017.1 hypothetical protein CBS115989_3926 [Aspergillus niger]RDH21202.1 DUF572-domain-containing protein [Aspergillus niger ATCC 13496]KAI2856383.1 hypothetical protein CBS11232_3734 [Aspergillus niger]KAI2877000.1 hypothetical protein CBS115988_4277 [Aspergillus niger]PYH56957.1 DUF572-domain-containing protein [Aspergillus niger CBS 101883]|eukprot:XP_001394562.2 hypothetical protein ANI_1_2068094 [Aspergillus niger CBS 513.88]